MNEQSQCGDEEICFKKETQLVCACSNVTEIWKWPVTPLLSANDVDKHAEITVSGYLESNPLHHMFDQENTEKFF